MRAVSGVEMLSNRSLFSRSFPAFLTLGVGLFVTLMIFIGVRWFEYDKKISDFQQYADSRIMAIKQGLDAEKLPNLPGIDLNIYAGQSPNEKKLVFRYGNAPPSFVNAFSRFGVILPQWILYNHSASVSRSFEAAGKPWHMIVSAQPVWFGIDHSGSLFILLAGTFFSLIVAVYLQTINLRSQRIQRMIDQRTAELRVANILLHQDIAARKRTAQALQLYERAIDSSGNAIIIANTKAPDYVIEYVNPAFERMTGYSVAEVVGRSSNFLWCDDKNQPKIADICVPSHERREVHAILHGYRKDGILFWLDVYIAPVNNDEGEINYVVVALYDITATKHYEAELEFQTNRDTLTGLANRNLLRDRLSQAIAYAIRYNRHIWVMFINLDRFKLVNDTLGHKGGDLFLKKISERLQVAVRETDTIARLGGDEFVLILPERTEENLAPTVVQRILDTVAKPLTVDEHEFFLTCSIGVAVYPNDGNDPETLIKHADIAMCRAKEVGCNTAQFYTAAMNEKVLNKVRIEADLRNALEHSEFILHYQPQVNLSTGQIVGMEALIRWNHPVLGMVSPMRFIGLAEETGLIVPIGAWVIRTACAQSMIWQQAGFGALRIAVNLSARQFAQKDLVQSVARVLEETGLAPCYLEIELTESLVMTDVELAIGILRDLKALGVQISIDDFGTGYSSLAYLKRFPIDVLKIDQSFIRDISTNPDDAAIVTSIISLAHSLRLQVIAEGVETDVQLSYLQTHGCDEMQGYYFSRPVPADDFTKLLQQKKSLPLELQE
jgi:diguanylate cyclase (GGDEF)-like protein/PAS domain S-box-containing protein